MGQLFTRSNRPTYISVSVERDPLNTTDTYRLFWHVRSADRSVLFSGEYSSLETMDECRAVIEAACEAFYREYEPSEWRRHLQRRLDAVLKVERSGSST